MGITYLPGLYDEIAPGLQNMQKMLQQFVNPHKDFQVGLRNAIATNPQLLQQLVDMEKNNPGFLKSINAGGLSDIAGGMQESFANIQDKDVRKTYANMTPQQKAEADAKKFGFRAGHEVEQDTAQLDATKTATEANKQQTEYYKQQSETTKTKEAQLANYRSIANNALIRIKSPSNLYAAIRSGALTPDERVAVMSLPEFETDIKFQQDEFWNQQRMALERENLARLQAGGNNFNLDELQQRHNVQRASEVVDRAGNSVDVKDVYQLLSNKTLRAEVEKWTKPPTDRPEDIAMFSAMQAIRNNQRQLSSTELLTARDKFDKITADYFKTANNTNLDRAQRVQAVHMINNAAAAIFSPLDVEPPVYGFGEEGDLTGASGKFREHTFFLKSADPKLAGVGFTGSGGGSSTDIVRGGKRLKSIDEAAETVKSASDKNTVLKQMKDAGYTEAEIGEIRTKAGMKDSTTVMKDSTTAPTKNTPKPVANTALNTDRTLSRAIGGDVSSGKGLEKDTALARATTGVTSADKPDMAKVSKAISDYHITKLESDKQALITRWQTEMNPRELTTLKAILKLQ